MRSNGYIIIDCREGSYVSPQSFPPPPLTQTNKTVGSEKFEKGGIIIIIISDCIEG